MGTSPESEKAAHGKWTSVLTLECGAAGHRGRLADWLTANRSGVMSVLKKLDTNALGVVGVGTQHMHLMVLTGEPRRPVTRAEAVERGMTEAEFKDFDLSVDYDDLTVILDWQACKVVWDEAADDFIPVVVEA